MYQFRAIPFGLCTAPQVFESISVWAHARGIRLHRYLDDWLILGSLEAEVRQHIRMLLSLCKDLGILVNKEKSDLEPKQMSSYLMMVIDTIVGKVFPTQSRVENIMSVGSVFLLSLIHI